MFKRIATLLSHLFNYALAAGVISIQFMLASGNDYFIIDGRLFTAEQFQFIAKMCVGILTIRVFFHFLPQIKDFLSKR